MKTIEPMSVVLGATAHGIDLVQPLSERHLGADPSALARHRVLRFPIRTLISLKRFLEQVGEIQGWRPAGAI